MNNVSDQPSACTSTLPTASLQRHLGLASLHVTNVLDTVADLGRRVATAHDGPASLTSDDVVVLLSAARGAKQEIIEATLDEQELRRAGKAPTAARPGDVRVRNIAHVYARDLIKCVGEIATASSDSSAHVKIEEIVNLLSLAHMIQTNALEALGEDPTCPTCVREDAADEKGAH